MNDTTQTADDNTAQAGYEIVIKVDGDGSVSVGVEDGENGEPDDSGLQAVSGFKQALQIAGDIYKNHGQMSTMTDNSSAMDAGYSGKKPAAAPSPITEAIDQ